MRSHDRAACSALLPLLALLFAAPLVVCSATDVGAPAKPASVTTPRSRSARSPNGMRYYIRANTSRRKRAELRLVVNAGSVLEDDDQRGLAHMRRAHGLQRHEAISPNQASSSYHASRSGMRSAPDINAFTSFDETVYSSRFPPTRPAIVDKGFLMILAEWAHSVSFEPVADRQGARRRHRGMAARAGRRRADAGQVVSGPVHRLAVCRPAADRRPEIISRLQARSRPAKQFYDTTGTGPDMMAVIAVGDFDKATIEALDQGATSVRSRRRRPRSRGRRTRCPITGHATAVVTDQHRKRRSHTSTSSG